MDKRSSEQQFHKSDITGAAALVQSGLMEVGWHQADEMLLSLVIFIVIYWMKYVLEF